MVHSIKQSYCCEASLKEFTVYAEFHEPVGIFHLLDHDLKSVIFQHRNDNRVGFPPRKSSTWLSFRDGGGYPCVFISQCDFPHTETNFLPFKKTTCIIFPFFSYHKLTYTSVPSIYQMYFWKSVYLKAEYNLGYLLSRDGN